MNFLSLLRMTIGFLVVCSPVVSFAAINSTNNPCSISVGQSTCSGNPVYISGNVVAPGKSLDLAAGVKVLLFDKASNTLVRNLFDTANTGTLSFSNIAIPEPRVGTPSSPSHSVRMYKYYWVPRTNNLCTNGTREFKNYGCFRSDIIDWSVPQGRPLAAGSADVDCSARSKPVDSGSCAVPVPTTIGYLHPPLYEDIDFTATSGSSNAQLLGTPPMSCASNDDSVCGKPHITQGPCRLRNYKYPYDCMSGYTYYGGWGLNAHDSTKNLVKVCFKVNYRSFGDWPVEGTEYCVGDGTAKPFNSEQNLFDVGGNWVYATVMVNNGTLQSIRYRGGDKSGNWGSIGLDVIGYHIPR